MRLNILMEIYYDTSNITNYKPKDFAELLGVSAKTLQRWDREGTLKANRTPTDRRYYTYDQYLQWHKYRRRYASSCHFYDSFVILKVLS